MGKRPDPLPGENYREYKSRVENMKRTPKYLVRCENWFTCDREGCNDEEWTPCDFDETESWYCWVKDRDIKMEIKPFEETSTSKESIW